MKIVKMVIKIALILLALLGAFFLGTNRAGYSSNIVLRSTLQPKDAQIFMTKLGTIVVDDGSILYAICRENKSIYAITSRHSRRIGSQLYVFEESVKYNVPGIEPTADWKPNLQIERTSDDRERYSFIGIGGEKISFEVDWSLSPIREEY